MIKLNIVRRFKPNFITPIEETLPLFLILYGKYINIAVVVVAVCATLIIVKLLKHKGNSTGQIK